MDLNDLKMFVSKRPQVERIKRMTMGTLAQEMEKNDFESENEENGLASSTECKEREEREG